MAPKMCPSLDIEPVARAFVVPYHVFGYPREEQHPLSTGPDFGMVRVRRKGRDPVRIAELPAVAACDDHQMLVEHVGKDRMPPGVVREAESFLIAWQRPKAARYRQPLTDAPGIRA